MSSAMGSSVEDVWNKLNEGTRNNLNKSAFDRMWHGFNNDAIRKQGTNGHVVATGLGSRGALAQLTKGVQRPSDKFDGVTHPVGPQKVQTSSANTDISATVDVRTSCQRALQQLQDPIASVRREALGSIKAQVIDRKSVPDSDLQDMLEGDLGKAILKRFDDKVEKCRELAVALYYGMVQACPDAILRVLPYAMSVLEERLQHVPGQGPVEPCEEIRLQLMLLLGNMVRTAGHAIGAYAAEAVAMAEAGFLDAFYEINVQACSVVIALNGILGLKLQPVAKQLVANALPLATHNRYRVRVAAIQAVRASMFQAAHEMILEMVAFRDPNVVPIKAFYGDDLKVNFCGKLSTDTNPQVRSAFLDMLGDWLLHLPERLDHEQRLLPYVLSALADPHPPIAEAALQLLHDLGELHMKDKGKELADTLRYLPEEAHALGWGAAGAGNCVYGDAAAMQQLHTGPGACKPLVMPPPFQRRPSLGSRLVVQANFGRTCGALCSELQGWMQGLKLRSAQLLRSSLVYLEDHVATHLYILLPALAKNVMDHEVGAVVADCLNIIGCFVAPEAWLQIITPRLEDAQTDTAARAGHLLTAAALARGVGPAASKQLAPLLAALLLPPNLKSEDTRVKAGLQQLLRTLLAHHPALCVAASSDLLLALLHLGSSPQAPEEQAAKLALDAEGLMRELAAICSAGDVDVLLARHRPQLIAQVACDGHGLHTSMDLMAMSRLIVPSSFAAVLLGCSSSHKELGHLSVVQQGSTSSDSWDSPTLQQLLAYIQAAVHRRPSARSTRTILTALDTTLHLLAPSSLNSCSATFTSLVTALCCGQQAAPETAGTATATPLAVCQPATNEAASLALKCLCTALRGKGLEGSALEREAAGLVSTLCRCLQSVLVVVRLQACQILLELLGSTPECLLLDSQGCAAGGSTQQHAECGGDELPPAVQAALQRCYDANEGVQAVAVQALERTLCHLSTLQGQGCGVEEATSGTGSTTGAGRLLRVLLHRVRSEHLQWGDGEVQVEAARVLQRFATFCLSYS